MSECQGVNESVCRSISVWGGGENRYVDLSVTTFPVIQAIPAHSTAVASIGNWQKIHCIVKRNIHVKTVFPSSFRLSFLAAFSYDGKMLASFSVSEKTVRVWHVVGSFFGMISSAPKCIGTFNVSNSIEDMGNLSFKIVWTDKKKVVLMAGDQEFMFSL